MMREFIVAKTEVTKFYYGRATKIAEMSIPWIGEVVEVARTSTKSVGW